MRPLISLSLYPQISEVLQWLLLLLLLLFLLALAVCIASTLLLFFLTPTSSSDQVKGDSLNTSAGP